MQAELARSLGEFFVGVLAIESDHAWRVFLELLCQQNPALGNFLPVQLPNVTRGALHQIGKADAEFDQALIIRVGQRLGQNARIV